MPESPTSPASPGRYGESSIRVSFSQLNASTQASFNAAVDAILQAQLAQREFFRNHPRGFRHRAGKGGPLIDPNYDPALAGSVEEVAVATAATAFGVYATYATANYIGEVAEAARGETTVGTVAFAPDPPSATPNDVANAPLVVAALLSLVTAYKAVGWTKEAAGALKASRLTEKAAVAATAAAKALEYDSKTAGYPASERATFAASLVQDAVHVAAGRFNPISNDAVGL